MNLDPSKTSFGRNETFNLKYSWLNKGLKEFNQNNNIFSESNAPLVLGVGKNMVNSIKYWLGAYQIINFSVTKPFVSDFGKSLNQYDPYLEDLSSLWLLHWKLCTNPDTATIYYWFFNYFKKTRFTKVELLNDLEQWLDDQGCKKASSATLDRDAQVLLKTFSVSVEKPKNIEEIIENPFNALNLLAKNNDGTYSAVFENRQDLNYKILGLCIIEVFHKNISNNLFDSQSVRTQMPVYEFLSEPPSISRIFKISESCFFQLLEELVSKFPNIFGYTETAGQKIIELKNFKITSESFMGEIYKR